MGGQSSKEVQGKPVVLVIGAGYAGTNFAKALDKTGNWNVVLVDRKDHFVHNVAAPRAAVKAGYESEILIPYTNLLKYGSVVQGEVTQITPEAVVINGHPEPIRFDYLVIATGSSYAFPGKLAETNVASAMAKYKACQEAVARAKKITIIGGGPVGVEMAGELAAIAKEGGKGITLVHSGENLVVQKGILPEFSAKLYKTLLDLGVKVMLNERVVLNNPSELRANYIDEPRKWQTQSGKEIEADLTFFCMGTKMNNASLGAFQHVMTNGRLDVDSQLRVKGMTNVFACGDICSLEHPMAVYGQQQAAFLVKHFESNLKKKKEGGKEYPPMPPISIVSVGPKHGAAQLPIGKGMVMGNTFAKTMKSGTLFTAVQWSLLNQDRKTKDFVDNGARPQSLAAAFALTEEEAKKIASEGLPELAERTAVDHA